MNAAEVHEIRQISSHESYHGWPTITRCRNGELLVVVSAGREGHICPFGQVHMLRSSDDGQTWTQKLLINGPLDDRDAGVLETAKGTLLVNWFTSIAWMNRLTAAEADPETYVGKDKFWAHCQKVRALLDDQTIARELAPWLMRSEDGGKTWSEKIDPCVGAPHGPTQLQDGRLLYVGNLRCKAGRRANGSPYELQLAASVSSDDGKSWSVLSELPLRAGDSPDTMSKYHEPHVVQAADGTIIVHIRYHGEKMHILQCESVDGGKTWSNPHDIGLFGSPAHLLRLRDGRLLTTYGYRFAPYGNRAAVSEDNGRTWLPPMTISAEEGRRDIGYPSSVEMADGTLLSVWYEYVAAKGNAVVRMAHWSIRN